MSRGKNCLENWELCFFWQFSFHDNRIEQSSHYCTSLANSVIQLFVLPSVTRKCNPKILKILQHASVSLHSLVTRADQGFLKDEIPLFWPCLFTFRRCCMHPQSCLMRTGDQILRKKAQPNHQRIADDRFCYFQLWHTHQLGCICLSSSCKQWKGEVTKRTLAGV